MIFHSTKPPEALQRPVDGKRAARGGNPRENSRCIRQLADLKSSQRKSFSARIFSGRANCNGCNKNARRKSLLPSVVGNLKVSKNTLILRKIASQFSQQDATMLSDRTLFTLRITDASKHLIRLTRETISVYSSHK